MNLLRRHLGEVLRAHRERQHRTLRDVSGSARVSLGYLSEVERGHKEASSELLAAICTALGLRVSQVLHEVADHLEPSETGLPELPALPALEAVPADGVLAPVPAADLPELEVATVSASGSRVAA
jgi:transcriptional regulator with XRE-family HTH domain